MENENVDNSTKGMYNTEIDDENVILVKMDEQAPINDVSCKHKTLVADPDDTIGEAIYHGCTNRKCGVGFYIKDKNLT